MDRVAVIKMVTGVGEGGCVGREELGKSEYLDKREDRRGGDLAGGVRVDLCRGQNQRTQGRRTSQADRGRLRGRRGGGMVRTKEKEKKKKKKIERYQGRLRHA